MRSIPSSEKEQKVQSNRGKNSKKFRFYLFNIHIPIYFQFELLSSSYFISRLQSTISAYPPICIQLENAIIRIKMIDMYLMQSTCEQWSPFQQASIRSFPINTILHVFNAIDMRTVRSIPTSWQTPFPNKSDVSACVALRYAHIVIIWWKMRQELIMIWSWSDRPHCHGDWVVSDGSSMSVLPDVKEDSGNISRMLSSKVA